MTRPEFPYDVFQFFLSAEEPAPATNPRPELAEAWASVMNHYPEIEHPLVDEEKDLVGLYRKVCRT